MFQKWLMLEGFPHFIQSQILVVYDSLVLDLPWSFYQFKQSKFSPKQFEFKVLENSKLLTIIWVRVTVQIYEFDIYNSPKLTSFRVFTSIYIVQVLIVFEFIYKHTYSPSFVCLLFPSVWWWNQALHRYLWIFNNLNLSLATTHINRLLLKSSTPHI